MADDDPYTVYDILWQGIGTPASDINLNHAKFFRHPLDFFPHMVFSVEDPAYDGSRTMSAEEISRSISPQYPYEETALKEVLELKQALHWTD